MLKVLIRRNMRLYFRDKGMFLTSLITPMILLILYFSFLGNVYRDSFCQVLDPFGGAEDKVLSALVGGQLISSVLAVSCVTVSFCSNFLMVQDKVTGAARDFSVTPARHSLLSLAYFLASFFSSLIICLAAAVLSLFWLILTGWYLTAGDVFLILLDVVILVAFGTALSGVINSFLSSQGQISAVGTVVSSCYGFICGAYMPISSFAEGLQTVISFLPGTYGTSLMRNHAMRGALAEMEATGVPHDVVEQIRDALDCNLYFFGNQVSEPMMYAILGFTIAVLIAAYIAINKLRRHA